MKINLSRIVFLIFLSFTSCIKEFIPHDYKYDELLVVEGAITDKPGPYTIKLSKAGNLREFLQNKPYSKCSVEIMDDVGNYEVLTEVTQGVYKTDPLGIQGIAGRKYKIMISTLDGRTYESQEELLKGGAGIDSVYAEVEYKNDPNLFYRREGCQFYIDPENTPENTSYYLWLLESTYKFRVDLDGDVALRTCYSTQLIKEIYTLNTADQGQHPVIRVPLNYEDNYTKALTIRYSLKVNQYTLNENAYRYWNTLRKMNANQGSLFTQQPYHVKGNVVNVSNSQEPVLGYFMVAGMSEKRIFVDRPPIVFRYSICVKDTSKPPTPPAPACYDCRESGYLKKPDFWID